MADIGTWVRPIEVTFPWHAACYGWRITRELHELIEKHSNSLLCLEIQFREMLKAAYPELHDAQFDLLHYDANRNCYMIRVTHPSLPPVENGDMVPFHWADRPRSNIGSGQFERQKMHA
jgi:hypothetical protein